MGFGYDSRYRYFGKGPPLEKRQPHTIQGTAVHRKRSKKLAIDNSDYKTKNIKGGSPKGRVCIRWKLEEKALIYVYALRLIANHNETIFKDSTIIKWSLKKFELCGFMLIDLFPSLVERSSHYQGRYAWARFIYCILQRHHKMFYTHSGGKYGVRGRAYSVEHPRNCKKGKKEMSKLIPQAESRYDKWMAENSDRPLTPDLRMPPKKRRSRASK